MERFISRGRVNVALLLAALATASCGGTGPSTRSDTGGSGGDETGGSGDTGGSKGQGGMTGTGGSGMSTGGSTGSAGSQAGSGGGEADSGPPASSPDADVPASDARGGPVVDSSTPMGTEGGPKPSYDGQIPIYYGPEVGPIVQMNCPGDPTAGLTEYKESFHVEHPYTLPTNTRFSIIGGIYNFWVFPNDAPHSPTAQGRNPRTEANYGGTYDKTPGSPGSDGNGHFISGMRMYSADMMVEKNAVGSAIMQIHTTATGGGPIGLRIQSNSDVVNNGSLTVVTGSSIPGGLIDKWFNFKASLDVSTMEVKIYINNCLTKTYKGDSGDGHFYFKNGVYFCKTSQNGCFSHYKNIHLYTK
jgi:hypothetical protein